MRAFGAGLVVAYLLLTAGIAFAQPVYQDVSVSELLRNPAIYADKQVRVHGFLIVQFEGDSIWVDEVAFRNEQYERGFWVDTRTLTFDEGERLTGRLAYVSGTFSLHHNGHLSLWPAAIDDVTVIEADPADKLEARPWRTEPFVLLLISLVVIGGVFFSVFLLGKRPWLLKQPAVGRYQPPRHM